MTFPFPGQPEGAVSFSAIFQMVQQNDEKHDEAHKRLRADFLEQKDTLRRIEERMTKQENRQAQPIDISTVMFSPKLVLSTIGVCVALIAGVYGVTYGVRSDVRDLGTRMEEAQQLQNERADNQRIQSNEVRQRVDLLSIQVQNFKDEMLKKER